MEDGPEERGSTSGPASLRPLRQSVARPIPDDRILHPDVISRREVPRAIERTDRDIDFPRPVPMLVGQR